MKNDPTRAYYDNFSNVYSDERREGYFGFINELEVDTLRNIVPGVRVLEVGCGTGLILDRVSHFQPSKLSGIDFSPGMLEYAKASGHDVVCGSVLSMPFQEGEFDVVYSFKVLPHIPDISKALIEIMRVTNKRGQAILEFYNPLSIKAILDVVRMAKSSVFLRHDTMVDIIKAAPRGVKVEAIAGVRIFGPSAWFYEGLAGRLFRWFDSRLMYTWIQRFAGYRIYRLTWEER